MIYVGKYREAVKSYDKALELDPKKTEAWYNKGFAFVKLGKYGEVIKSYDLVGHILIKCIQ